MEIIVHWRQQSRWEGTRSSRIVELIKLKEKKKQRPETLKNT